MLGSSCKAHLPHLAAAESEWAPMASPPLLPPPALLPQLDRGDLQPIEWEAKQGGGGRDVLG